MNIFKCGVLVSVVLMCSACGTMSGVKSPQSAGQKSQPVEADRFSRYSVVVINNFENDVGKKLSDPDKQAAYQEAVDIAGQNFADRVAMEIRKTGIFERVERSAIEGEALVISGRITRYSEGSAAARLFIGLGAGSSYFDADVDFKDNLTGEEIGDMKVDKNSWVLGGGIAAGQTVEHFMEQAAGKIADQLKKIKTETE